MEPQSDNHSKEIERTLERLKQLDAERIDLRRRLTDLMSGPTREPDVIGASGNVSSLSSAQDKIALFRELFSGRTDVYTKRWENIAKGKAGYAPACANEWKRGLCGKPAVRCGACPNQAFLPVTDATIEDHLRGRVTIGLYPMLPDGTCRFLAADFDKQTWPRDADAFLEVCKAREIPAALERSRSGNGAHVWLFFEKPVTAALARRLGALLLTEAMEQNPDIGFRSYDRFFPSQDTMPKGGFGNVIALPLQGDPRKRGNSVFLDEHFEPWPDQWAFLSALPRLAVARATEIADEVGRQGPVAGLMLPIEDDDEEPWTAPPSRRRPPPPIAGALPDLVSAVMADQIYIEREGLPSGLVRTSSRRERISSRK